MKKRVLFVVDERQMGGVSIALENTLSIIDYSKFDVDVLALHNNGDRLVNIPSNVRLIFGTPFFEVIDLPLNEVIHSRNLLMLIKKIFLIFTMKTGIIKNILVKERKKILDSQYDVEVAYKDGFPALFVSCGSSKKKVHWIHNEYGEANPNKNYSHLFQDVMKEFDQIVAVSSGVLSDFEKEYKISAKKTVIHNIIDVNRIVEMSNQDVFRVNNDDINLVSIGRLHSIKGFDRLILCLSELEKNNSSLLNNVKLFIIGDGPERDNLINLVKKCNLDDKIIFLGARDNPYYILKQMDLFILTSLYESFGLVCMEALILGVPVLATKTAGTIEIFSNYHGGLLVDNSLDEIYEILNSILNNPNRIKELKQEIDYNSNDEDQKVKQIMEVLNCD